MDDPQTSKTGDLHRKYGNFTIKHSDLSIQPWGNFTMLAPSWPRRVWSCDRLPLNSRLVRRSFCCIYWKGFFASWFFLTMSSWCFWQPFWQDKFKSSKFREQTMQAMFRGFIHRFSIQLFGHFLYRHNTTHLQRLPWCCHGISLTSKSSCCFEPGAQDVEKGQT